MKFAKFFAFGDYNQYIYTILLIFDRVFMCLSIEFPSLMLYSLRSLKSIQPNFLGTNGHALCTSYFKIYLI